MPFPFRLTPRALEDIDEIWHFIAADNIEIEAANRVESAILMVCTSLARHPQLGSRRIEITSLPGRFWTVTRFPNFILVYRPDVKPLQVVAVLLHGKRDLKQLLGEPDPL